MLLLRDTHESKQVISGRIIRLVSRDSISSARSHPTIASFTRVSHFTRSRLPTYASSPAYWFKTVSVITPLCQHHTAMSATIMIPSGWCHVGNAGILPVAPPSAGTVIGTGLATGSGSVPGFREIGGVSCFNAVSTHASHDQRSVHGGRYQQAIGEWLISI